MNLVSIFSDMDRDGSGNLSMEEVLEGYSKFTSFRDCMSELGLEAEDLRVVWTILNSDKNIDNG